MMVQILSLKKNVLTAKNTGTVVIKVTIGHGIPRIRTKK